MTDDAPNETDVASLAEQIDARPWAVTGYDFEGGSAQSFTVTLDIEWVGDPDFDEAPRNIHSGMKSLVSEIEAEYQEGAPVSELLARAEDDLDLDRETAEHELDKLRRQGDVYEPTTDHLRVV